MVVTIHVRTGLAEVTPALQAIHRNNPLHIKYGYMRLRSMSPAACRSPMGLAGVTSEMDLKQEARAGSSEKTARRSGLAHR
jgi:hypothetical protein